MSDLSRTDTPISPKGDKSKAYVYQQTLNSMITCVKTSNFVNPDPSFEDARWHIERQPSASDEPPDRPNKCTRTQKAVVSKQSLQRSQRLSVRTFRQTSRDWQKRANERRMGYGHRRTKISMPFGRQGHLVQSGFAYRLQTRKTPLTKVPLRTAAFMEAASLA